MKKILILILLSSLLLVSTVLAQENRNQPEEPSQIQNQEQTMTQEDASGMPIMSPVRARNTEQLRTMIQEKQQVLSQQAQGIQDEKQQAVYQNQNKVKEAVHALLAAEELAGDVGPQMSQIAREFNGSVQATIISEEKIQNRGGITMFFFGGDKEAAEEIIQEVNQNQVRIQQLKELQKQCSYGPEAEEMIQEQIRNIVQEQTRLQTLADGQKSRKGLFGWLFGWLTN